MLILLAAGPRPTTSTLTTTLTTTTSTLTTTLTTTTTSLGRTYIRLLRNLATNPLIGRLSNLLVKLLLIIELLLGPYSTRLRNAIE